MRRVVVTGVGDRVAHREVRVRRGIAHEALELAIDLGEIDRRTSGDAAAQAALGGGETASK